MVMNAGFLVQGSPQKNLLTQQSVKFPESETLLCVLWVQGAPISMKRPGMRMREELSGQLMYGNVV